MSYLKHLFYDCEFVKSFWQSVEQFFEINLTNHIELNPNIILLGSKKGTVLENHIILICKRYIYSCRLDSLIPNFHQALIRIKSIRNIEKYIAKSNNKVLQFEKKWLFLS